MFELIGLENETDINSAVAFLREAVILPGVTLATNINNNDVAVSYGVVTTGTVDTGTLASDAVKIAQGEKGFVSNFAYEVSKHRNYERELDGLTAKVAY
ncbi:hypothetical protein QCA50_001529 [Cerrena zonata]|uniref:Uncharacterized protein n=1 Tax=Cerrena zonata TaxID=2478898 RepID=A0AAW0GX91_9APHY